MVGSQLVLVLGRVVVLNYFGVFLLFVKFFEEVHVAFEGESRLLLK